MPQVTFILENGKELTHYTSSGTVLLEVIRKCNLMIDAPCSGNATCGKCKVKLLEGDLQTEMSRHITNDEYDSGYRLACISKIKENVTVQIPDTASAYKNKMKVTEIKSGEELKIFSEGLNFGNKWESIEVTMEPPTLDDTMPDNERFSRAIKKIVGDYKINIPYYALKRLPDFMRTSNFKINCIIKKDKGEVTIYKIRPSDEKTIPFGIAMDVGTTSVSALLVNLLDGSIVAKASAGNGQIPFGADVINRIIESTKLGGRKKMQTAIIEKTINPMITEMCGFAKLEPNSIVEMCISGNTTMNHLLLGMNTENIRMEPYIPTFFEVDNVLAEYLDIKINPIAELVFTPNIGSYVGGDITSGVLASKIWNKEELSLFIDLGTNGEIVIGNKDFLMSCACSAGPAFEGGEISCGMRATDGAIEALTIDENTLEPNPVIIGEKDTKAVGICGSGIIDLISEMYRCGIINSKGIIVKEGDRITRDEYGTGSYIVVKKEDSGTRKDIVINEVDIDNFVRAKGAIFSAVKLIVESLDMDTNMIEKIYVAGGIGSGINFVNAIRIGLFPNISLDLFEYIGNSSLMGAYGVVTSQEAKEKVREIGRGMTYVELSTDPRYMDEFVAACFIPHTDENLFRGVQ